MSTDQSTADVVIEHATSRRPEGIISLAESVGHMPPDADKVADLAASMERDGWRGAPILTYGGLALTGTHRIAAARSVDAPILALDLYDLADDADRLVMAIMDATGWEGPVAAAEAVALILGRAEAAELGDDLDREERELRWALDTTTDTESLEALRQGAP